MPSNLRWPTRLAAAILAAVALVFGALVLAPTTAGAHAEIRSAEPAPGGTTAQGTDEVVLRFISTDPDAPIEVAVLDAEGTDRVSGEVDVSGRDLVVTVPVEPLEAGEHTVEWSAQSTDGDGRTEGSYGFTVEEGPSELGTYLLWAVAIAIPAVIFVVPSIRRGRLGTLLGRR